MKYGPKNGEKEAIISCYFCIIPLIVSNMAEEFPNAEKEVDINVVQ
jgi:hypothetical protein